VLSRRNVLYFLDNAIVFLSACRLLAPHRVGQTVSRNSSLAIEPIAYAAMQKKVWLRKKNAYLVLTRESASPSDRHQPHG
jgi:hypothetical protein